MLKNINLFLIILFTFFSFDSNAQSYENTKVKYYDPLQIKILLQENFQSRKSKFYDVTIVNPNKGYAYATMTKGDVDLLLKGNQIDTSLPVNKKTATHLKTIIEKSDQSVPFSVQTMIGLVEAATTKNIVVSIALNYLIDALAKKAVHVKLISNIIVDGGKINRHLFVFKDEDSNFHLQVSYEYEVQVGKENRYLLLGSYTFPIKVEITEFTTQVEFNNKKLILSANKTWQFIDLESGFTEGTFTLLKQENGYYYFKEIETEFDEKVIHRISTTGGKWERIYSENEITMLYENVVAK